VNTTIMRPLLVAGAVLLLAPAIAFAWIPTSTHPDLIRKAVHDNAVLALAQEFLSSDQIETISSYSGDGALLNGFHGNWDELRNRAYCSETSPHNWASLLSSPTTALCYLMHNATDTGVPIGHSPAGISDPAHGYTGYAPGGLDPTETLFELAIGGKSSSWYANINGTSIVSSVSGTFYYTGTYWDIVNTHIAAVQANSNYFRQSSSSDDVAGMAGTTQGQLFARAVFADYLLQRRPTIANAGTSYTATPGGSVTFSSAGSRDDDSISWAGNGTYSNNGGGLSAFAWDLNNDGTYETSAASPTLTYSQVVSMAGVGMGKTIRLRVTDDEGAVGYASASLNVIAIPEPGAIAMMIGGGLGLAGLVLARRRRVY
jgi:hypothetical protein